MYKELKRKPNNLKSFTVFYYVSVSLLCIIDFILLYFMFEAQYNQDLTLVVGTVMVFSLWILMIVIGKKQIKSKKSYMNMTQPLLTLTDTKLIYILNDREKYSIEWNEIDAIQVIENLEKYRDEVGIIRITCKEKSQNKIKETRKDSYYNDLNHNLDIQIMNFYETLEELENIIQEFYKNARSMT